MGSVAAAVQEDSPSSTEAAFLERCAASGDAAYGELRELLSRLHDPATRQEARVFLTGLRRRSCSGEGEEGFFRRYGFCVRELLLHDSRCGLPITTLSSVEDALQRLVNQKRLGQGQTKTAAARHISEAHRKAQLSCQP